MSTKEVSRTGGAGWGIEQTIENLSAPDKVQQRQQHPADPAILAEQPTIKPKLEYTPPERVCIFTGQVAERQRFLNGKTIWLSEEAYNTYTTGEIVQQYNLKEKEYAEKESQEKTIEKDVSEESDGVDAQTDVSSDVDANNEKGKQKGKRDAGKGRTKKSL